MLGLNLQGKLALVAGVADDQGYGWAIAKALKKAGARVIITTWPPALNILRMSLERGKLDTDLVADRNDESSISRSCMTPADCT